jgi:hypothetical protein
MKVKRVKKKLHDNIAKAYTAFIENEIILIAGKEVTSKQEFIQAFRKTIKYKHIKNIITECNETIKPKLEKQLNKLQTQTNKIQRQLSIMTK